MAPRAGGPGGFGGPGHGNGGPGGPGHGSGGFGGNNGPERRTGGLGGNNGPERRPNGIGGNNRPEHNNSFGREDFNRPDHRREEQFRPDHREEPRPMHSRPEPPMHHKTTGIGGSILGSLLASAVAGTVLQNSAGDYSCDSDNSETAAVDTETTVQTAGEIDYSDREGYPDTCPSCGAPTSGRKKCEYCDSTLI